MVIGFNFLHVYSDGHIGIQFIHKLLAK